MPTDGSLPSYDQLFGDLDFRAVDDARSVYSPAAYLADLLQLVRDHIVDPTLIARRPTLEQVPLDAENSYTELPYLDIVNEILAAALGVEDAYGELRKRRFPVALPFALRNERLKTCLGHLGVTPAQLYERFAPSADPDTVARLQLGLSEDDVDSLTTPLASPQVNALDVDVFRRAAQLSAVELQEVLATSFVGGGSGGSGGNGTSGLGPEVRDRVVRFVRLARRIDLPFADLDVMLRTCCGNRIDHAALRYMASLTRLQRGSELPMDVACSLVAPMDQGMLPRVFPGQLAGGPRGDLLANYNREHRRQLAAALVMSESDLTKVVERFRARAAGGRRSQDEPFDRPDGHIADLSLLHRVSRLATALDTSVDELFGVLDVLEGDASFPWYFTFPVTVRHEPKVRDCYRMLDAADIDSSLCLVQALFAVLPWMRAQGFTGQELVEIAAARPEPEGQLDVLESLGIAFDEVALTPAVFASDRFSERAAEVVHDIVVDFGEGVVSDRDPRLLRLDPATAETAAYTALGELGAVAKEDFLGLGLGERLAAKIFANLVHRGVLAADGALDERMLPAAPAALRLATDFSDQRDALMAQIAELGGGEAPENFYPSDLASFTELTEAETAELYDNLVFHGYLDVGGEVLRPDEFTADNLEVNADLDEVAPAVLDLLRGRVEEFRREPLALDPEIFAPLGLGEDRLADLLDSLRFNGYLDAEGLIVDKVTLVDLDLADLNLALEFYPHRRRILDAVQEHIAAARTERYTFTPEDFTGIADDAAAEQVIDRLDGTFLVESRVPQDLRASFLEPAEMPELGDSALGGAIQPGDQALIVERIAEILREQQPYRLDLDALAELGFDTEERDQLVAMLVAAGDLTEELTVARDRLAFFGTVHNALGFALPGLEDYGKDVFFLLHSAATELAAGMAEITAKLTMQAGRQQAALFAVLQDALALPAATVEAICVAVTGSREDALELLVAPVLAAAHPETGRLTAAPPDPHLRAAYRRIRRFAQLAAKLGLDATEVAVAFADQDLVGKFPEPLALPPGVDRIDALLPSRDGNVYLFGEAGYWTYSATTYALADPQPRPLTDLSARLTPLATVDAAFTDALGIEWIVGRGTDGTALAFIRAPGSTRWIPRTQVWGKVRNAFTDAARIDAAYVDEAGRTYLFCGDQYIRYSRPDYAEVDEGYPRSIGEWWAAEGRQAPLPERFRSTIDAAFEGADGNVHLFAGGGCLAVTDGPTGAVTEAEIEDVWGRIRNSFEGARRIDAAYADGASTYLFAGNQVVGYSDSVENEGVRVDDGYPRRIESHLPDVPVEFEGGLDAGFVDAARVVHLFKDGKTASISAGAATVAPTVERWGVLGPVLPSGTVDAGFVGLDGKTYLFSGEQYLRYSGADYGCVDIGYPRGIAGDWGGLRRVDASFVLDGMTYLFGVAGQLCTLPVEYGADLTAGRVSPALRQQLARHGITLPEGAKVEGQGTWWITAETGIRLALTRTGTQIAVVGDNVDAPFYVRYSTRDYTKPDAGYPRPLTDDWWTLPTAQGAGSPTVRSVDAVFTGRDNKTYLFSGNQFVVFDHRRRWWSEPQHLNDKWDSLPFGQVDAAFVGTDGKTYVFSGPQYVRYSDGDYTRVDDRYPAAITSFWGKVANNLARTGRVDAALVVGEYTYLFSGEQYVRYTGSTYRQVDAGYPRRIQELRKEPRFGNLGAVLDGPIDAAFADQRNIYLFSGRRWHVVSDLPYRAYQLPAPAGCAFVEDGSILVEETPTQADAGGWRRYSAIEGNALARTAARPRVLRSVPSQFRAGLDAVLHGTDGNTYLFAGTSCFDLAVRRAYPLAEAWGRPRNTIRDDNAVDAAFVGRDGRTYVFRGDQFVVYAGGVSFGDIDGGPRPVTQWGGLTSVRLAYVEGGRTFLFERPAADGTMRYVVYSGANYTAPDPGYPAVTNADFWEIPQAQRPAGFVAPDAVLFEGETMLLVCGEQYLQRGASTAAWSYPRPLTRLWRDLGPGAVTAAFTERDGATHIFFRDGEFTTYRDQASARRPIREAWARLRNNLLGSDGTGRVDAAFVHRGTTYLFSGDQYVRYSGSDYRFADAGYPRLLAGNLRTEAPFAQLPEAFEDVLTDRVAAGGPAVDAVVANDRTVYVFVGTTCHVASQTATASYDIGTLGRVRNTVADRGRVDAALMSGAHTFLFSGDQYVRYTGADYVTVDDGYPRTLESSLAADLDLRELPGQFRDGLDAAFRGPDGRTYLFAGRYYLRSGDAPQPIAGSWGMVRNAFAADGSTNGSVDRSAGVDAAFVAPTGELFAFRGGQYVRYRPGQHDVVEDGYPRSIRDDWGDLPADFEAGIDGAFSFEGRTYLTKRDSYVRYSHGYRGVDRTYPQPFSQRWSHSGDYRLGDLHTIARFVRLARAHPGSGGGLPEFLATGRATIADPYAYLGELFGWDPGEIRWAKRHAAFPTGRGTGERREDRLDVEFVLQLADLFALAERLGAGPSRIYSDIWQGLYGAGASGNTVDAALAALYELLARGRGPDEWAALSRLVENELNVRKRDALVAAVLTRDPADQLATSLDLFERFLIDVDMGGQGRTSRVREAIAATQLWVHRYLLNLEPATARGSAQDVRAQIRRWWGWMRTYRVWEANRKVFLYPENYLRPELRAAKTPAFRALESDLLQGEITPASVQAAYKRYLDEYTEVSRLTIAGGYVYAQRPDEPGTRSLVLFGRTKTDPRRYYYRHAAFRDGDKLSTTWQPWLPVGVAIDADTVYPTYAFDRVFVFWATVEAVKPDPAAGTTVTAEGETYRAAPTQARQRVKILYSFYNLTGEWVPPQELGTGVIQPGTISGISLSVRAPQPQPDEAGPVGARGPIEVSCGYTVTLFTELGPGVPVRQHAAFALHPELYAVALATTTDEVVPDIASRLGAIFGAGERIEPNQVVRFSSPTESADAHWFSVDHKGGSFLCRPAVIDTTGTPAEVPLIGNEDRLPDWDRIDAAVELPGGARYFFVGSIFLTVPDGETPKSDEQESSRRRWGQRPLPFPRDVLDGIFARDDLTFAFRNDRYVRYTGESFHATDPGYPKPLEGNTERLPELAGVVAAFRGLDGYEYFFYPRNFYMRSGSLPAERQQEHWGLPGPVDAAFVDERGQRTYLFSGNQYVRYSGTRYEKPDAGYPKTLGSDGADRLPSWSGIAAAFNRGGSVYLLDPARENWLVIAPNGAQRTYRIADYDDYDGLIQVDAAWVRGERLYLASGTRLSRYTLDAQHAPGPFVDAGYPVTIPRSVDFAFDRDGDLYVFCGDAYTRLAPGRELQDTSTFTQIEGNWGDLPAQLRQRVTGSLDTSQALHLFVYGSYLTYPKTGVAVPRPYELATMKREIVRLTSGSAATLNQLMLSGGVPALLAPGTQETDEVPRLRSDAATDEFEPAVTVTLRDQKVEAGRLPASTHLDFDSANGQYYWEIFFHAPLLIAQALNGAQRFEDARRWYEYVFDPTEPAGYWRFLPFLAVDVDALIERLTRLKDEANSLWPGNRTINRLVQPVLDDLATVAPAFRYNRTLTDAEEDALDRLAATPVPSALAGHERKAQTYALRVALHRLQETTGVVAGLRRQYDLMGDAARLLAAYREDPFDPHAIAELRPVAYRRAVVMAYIDNLLDWGDMLFRQYTAESIDEARMLYIFAHDLLGAQPESLGTQLPAAARSVADLDAADAEAGNLDLLSEFVTGGGALTEGAGAVHRSVADSYFHIPPNTTFEDYWARVNDRLRKIRQSLNILGISQPVPLFEPPIDVMAAVRAAAAGGDAAGELGLVAAVPVPHHRFSVVFRRAQELADKVRQLGNDLLGVLERRDSEELGLLQSRQEGVILGLTRDIKDAQVRIAAERVEELRASRAGTEERVAHFAKLIADGPSSSQKEQIALMTRARDAHYASAGLKIAAAIATGAPQVKLGPFILGFEIGGDQIGGALQTAAEVSESFGEAFSMAGELLGVQAEVERAAEDWSQQLADARSDLLQIGHQLTAAELQLASAEREAEITEREIANQEAVAAFLRDKFGNAELYRWMSGRLAGLYFEAYHLAYELARSAERAFQFERGVPEGEVSHIRASYWESRRAGLLAGDALALDLERLGKAWFDGDVRGLEISKRVSLLDLDPVAFLRLTSTGTAEFALTEALFDHDFPGHYRRQLRTVTVTFVDADGEPVALNATLTQLAHKTVLAADPKAVKFLLTPVGQPPDTVRGDWRPSQRIALSHFDERGENNGLHELRFDDERYLPFEGTGAVSTWRLRIAGRAPELSDVRDVVVTVRYTADDGGDVFAAAVRGMLKPYVAARFFDIAAEFPQEWSDFHEGDGSELVLPFTADMFPGMASRQITGIYPTYDLANGDTAELVLTGERPIELDAGRLLPTPGLRVGTNGGPGWAFRLDGDKEDLRGVGLVLTYKAGV